MSNRLFVDMDGTIAVFHPLNRSEFFALQKTRSARRTLHPVPIETLYQKGYFLNLEPMNGVLSAVKQIVVQNSTIEVFILSAYLSDSRYALTEKSLWLDRHLPEVPTERRILIPFGKNKSEMIKGGLRKFDYLLDDYTKNLASWNTSNGIKLLNGINHTHGTWQGNRIRCDKQPSVIAQDIVRIIERGETIRDDRPQTQNRIQRSFERERCPLR